MRKITIYNFITLNGFFKGPGEDTSWQVHGQEEGEFASKSASSDNILLFGRKTYEHMASFWPTPQAKQMMPELAESMNKKEKIVFSNSLRKADWNNTRVMSGDIISEMKRMKQEEGSDMTVLGSGSIITQFADAGIIDVFTFMLNPVAIGEGTPVFHEMQQKLDLELTDTRTFKSGVILLNYIPRR